VRDPAVLAAISAVPREAFVDPGLADRAGDDEPLPIGEGQTTSQPLVVALMAGALDLAPSDRVLEVGAGSGYAAAVLGRLAAEVHAVEIREALARRAAENVARAGCDNVHVHLGDGRRGWPDAAPFDAISVAAGAPEIPDALIAQLAPGGRLVMPVGPGPESQRLMRVRRSALGATTLEDLGAPVRFVPLIGGDSDEPRA
jgi:protein-L-isoaspartate(D-aspartate) O-methyltransferase